jgi:hypothetical protein
MNKLKNSPVYYYYKVNAIICCFLLIFFVLMTILLFYDMYYPIITSIENYFERILTAAILSFLLPELILIPAVIYYVYKMVAVARTPLVNIQKVKLEKISDGFFGLVSFEFNMIINGIEKSVSTPTIFGVALFGRNRISDYIGKEVEVAYNEKLDVAIILASSIE